jgi:hypothetical protein
MPKQINIRLAQLNYFDLYYKCFLMQKDYGEPNPSTNELTIRL